MKSARILLPLLVLALFATACRQRPTPPEPGMTHLGQAGSGGSGWVNPAMMDGFAGAEGLELRSSAFDSPNGEALAGILPSVYFAFDQAGIRPSDRPALQQAADYLRENSSARLIIEGHCDWRGTTEYNMALGERRAGSARDYLISLGVSRDRVEIVSKGDLDATESNSESQLQEDRRADILVLR